MQRLKRFLSWMKPGITEIIEILQLVLIADARFLHAANRECVALKCVLCSGAECPAEGADAHSYST